MMRKLNFFGQSRKSRKSRGRKSNCRQRGALGQPVLSVEPLELRCMLAANPILSLQPNQFFGQNTQFTVSDFSVPFHAKFTDVVDQLNVDNSTQQSYVAAIDWGDGSPIDTPTYPPHIRLIFSHSSM